MPNFTKIVTKIFGSKADKDFKELHPYIEKINEQFNRLNSLTDEELQTKYLQHRLQIKNIRE